MYNKYAQLLTNYCLEVQKGDRVLIKSTYLSEKLLLEMAKEVSKSGGHPVLDITVQDFDNAVLSYSDLSQLEWVNPMTKHWNEHFECYINIRAPFLHKDTIDVDIAKRQAFNDAYKEVRDIYSHRTGNRTLRRSLCQFPNEAGATEAGMTLEEYEKFVFTSCNLYEEDPIAAWRNFGKNQQKVVDYLNAKTKIQYKGSHMDLTFSTEGRLWINSDGKTNMPSGEVYTAPVDNSMNGWIKYSLPSIYMGEEVPDVELNIKDGYVESWNASANKEFLDKIFSMPGARRFGEAAVGTNYNIKTPTKNILFDEKIGGTVHLAIGDAYKQCHGVNVSAVHWDMITDMTNGEIYADGELCYKNGRFIID